MIVLTVFFALATSSVMGLLFACASDDAIDDLNQVATSQTRPLYETPSLLLRTRITLVAAYMDVLDGRNREA